MFLSFVLGALMNKTQSIQSRYVCCLLDLQGRTITRFKWLILYYDLGCESEECYSGTESFESSFFSTCSFSKYAANWNISSQFEISTFMWTVLGNDNALRLMLHFCCWFCNFGFMVGQHSSNSNRMKGMVLDNKFPCLWALHWMQQYINS